MACIDDLPALCAINQAALSPADGFALTRLRYLVRHARVLIIEQGLRPAGFCVLVPRGKTAKIHAIAVAPEHRRQGYGSALLEAAAARAARLRCEIRASNVASEALFKKAGYSLRGMQTNVYANGEAALIYESSGAIRD